MIKRGVARRLGLRLPRRTGGPVNAGSTYLVGEHGCELWTRKRGGLILGPL